MQISLPHRLWRAIPRPVRSRVFNFSTSTLAPKAAALEQTGRGEVTVAGLFSTASGLGAGARRLTYGLQASGIDTHAFDLGPAFRQSNLDWHVPPPPATSKGPLIVHINGQYLPYALLKMPSKFTAKRYVIGYWNWELPIVPESWRLAEKHVHEIWTASQFTAAALRARIKSPVHVVPYPLKIDTPSPMQRAELGIPENAFLVFNAFNAGSGYSRKNPDGVVDAFIQAFGGNSEAYLLIKIGDANLAPSQINSLRERIANHQNISLLMDIYSDADVLRLITMCDVVMSLHRSEGFGFLMAEAMHLGRPVIATNWSGNVDFMSARNSWPVAHGMSPCFDPQGTYTLKDAMWAEPDVNQAAGYLLEIYNDPDSARRKTEIAHQDIADYTAFHRFKAALPPEFLERCQTDALSRPGEQTARATH